MSYTVTASERNNESASTQETKALLYLMNFRQDSDDIFYYVIDFFNDVTGVDRAGSCGWDVQAKASGNLTQSKVGRYLVTLYKNYLSDFKFNSYILFTNGFLPSILIEVHLHEFDIHNFTVTAQKAIFKYLKDEATKRAAESYAGIFRYTEGDVPHFITFVRADNEAPLYRFFNVNDDIIDDIFEMHRFAEEHFLKNSVIALTVDRFPGRA